MRRINLVAAVIATAFLTQTAGAYAADGYDSEPTTVSAAVVLDDIADALAEQPNAPQAVAETLGDNGNATDRLETDLPDLGSQTAAATSVTGTLTMGVPAIGSDLAPESATTAVFEGSAVDTSVAVQNTTEGLRALVHIDSADAPERFDFPIGGDVATLQVTANGGAEAFNTVGDLIATAPAPWASDADGTFVPTHFEVNGTTLTQVVEHRAGGYAYGIVADPWWNPFSWNWDKIGDYVKKGAKLVAKVAACSAAIAVAVHPGAKAFKFIKEIGGAKKAAQLFIGAGKISDVKKVIPGAAESILGIAAIKSACF